MKKWQLILFYIFTFGIGYFYIKSKAKKVAEEQKEEIEVATEIPFEVQNLLNLLGGLENVVKTDSTISSFKVELKDANLADIDSIKKLDNTKGVMKSGNKLNIVFGDYSKTLDSFIKDLKKK